MKKKGILLLYPFLCLLLAFSVAVPAFAQAPPPTPHSFYGTVIVDGAPATAGATIAASGAGVMTPVPYNPLTTEVDGEYGSHPVGPWLVVQGYIDEGTPIEFYVNGAIAQCYDVEAQVLSDTYPFHSGTFTELNLIVGEAPPPTFTADAGGPYSGIVGESITLEGSASGGTPDYTYDWDLDNDGQYDDATGASPSYSWDTADIYTIGLRVTDDTAATATDTAMVTVTEEAFDPWDYDTDEDGVMSKAETLAAVADYVAETISKDDALEVVKLYFLSP